MVQRDDVGVMFQFLFNKESHSQRHTDYKTQNNPALNVTL